METATVEWNTFEFEFPMYSIADGDANPMKKSPIAIELNVHTGERYGLLFTSPETAKQYIYNRGLTIEAKPVLSSKDLYVIARQLVEKHPSVKHFVIDASGGPGEFKFASIRDVALALR